MGHTTTDSISEQATQDWQEKVLRKLSTIRKVYSNELTEMHQIICQRIQPQRGSQLLPLRSEQEALVAWIRVMQLLLSPERDPRFTPSLEEHLDAFEEEIVALLKSYLHREPVSMQQQIQENLIQPSELSHVQMSPALLEGQSTLQLTQPPAKQSCSQTGASGVENQQTSSTLLPTNSAIGHTTIDSVSRQVTGDWQEKVLRELRIISEIYFKRLAEVHSIIWERIHQQLDSQTQPLISDRNAMLTWNSVMQLLCAPELDTRFTPGLEEHLDAFEEEIYGLLKLYPPKEPVSMPQQIQHQFLSPIELSYLKMSNALLEDQVTLEHTQPPAIQSYSHTGASSVENQQTSSTLLPTKQQEIHQPGGFLPMQQQQQQRQQQQQLLQPQIPQLHQLENKVSTPMQSATSMHHGSMSASTNHPNEQT